MHAFAISAYDKFEEVAVLVEIIRENWSDEYLIVVCSAHPDAAIALKELAIDSFVALKTVDYSPGDGMPILTARVFHSIQASCEEAVRLGASSVTHLHSDSWPLSEERYKRLLKRLEGKSVVARGPGLGERGYLTPLGSISDMFLVMSSKWLIETSFFDLDPFDFPLDALNIHGLLSIIIFANGGFSELDFYDDYKNQEIFPGVFKEMPAKVASYPSIFNKSWALLHVHCACYPDDLGRKLQASYLLEYNLLKGNSISKLVANVDGDFVRREIRERFLSCQNRLARRNLVPEDFGQELLAMEVEVKTGYLGSLKKGGLRRFFDFGRLIIERKAFGRKAEPRFRLSREFVFKNSITDHYRKEFGHLSKSQNSEKIWFLDADTSLNTATSPFLASPAISFKKRVFENLKKNPALLAFIHPTYCIVRLYFLQTPLSFINRIKSRFFPVSGISDDLAANSGVIVSLTSFGDRLQDVAVCLETLFRQSIKANRIILWIAEEEREQVPASVTRLKERGLEIKFCPDWRAYKKIIPTLLEGHHVPIVTADDDVFYPSDWLEGLLLAYKTEQKMVHCHRSTIIDFENSFSLSPYQLWGSGSQIAGMADFKVFPTGVGGVLYPPGCFHKDVTDSNLFMKLSPLADDIWLKAMTLKAGFTCRQTRCYQKEFLALPRSQDLALFQENVFSGSNDRQLELVFNKYGLFAQFNIQENFDRNDN